VAPLASLEHRGRVAYVGSLAKVLAPGLRTGYIVADRGLLRQVEAYRATVDTQGDAVTEAAIALLIEEGELTRHARRMRRVYQTRQSALGAALRRHLADVVAFDVPAGGMALWARADGIDVDAWAERAVERRVLFQTGARFAFDGKPRPYLRLGFAALDEAELDEGVRRMALALRG
jgi:GntR family transcriptional regulator/MocR family aminotransferase